MSDTVFKTIAVSEIASVGERKLIGEKQLALTEFRLKGLGLRCNAWGDLADQVPAVGSRVVAEGNLRTRSYLHQETQQQRETTEFVVSSITALDGQAPRAVTATQPAPQPAPAPAAPMAPQLPDGGF